MQQLKKKTEGFTIIEVMIVLVIAAVIILIVFLAVPALQRNSRNNQRKNDVARLSAAITEVANNNNGALPTTTGEISGTVGSLGFYGTSYSYSGSATSNTDENTVIIRNSATCSTGGSGDDNVTVAAGSTRQFVILYSVENGGSGNDQCLQG